MTANDLISKAFRLFDEETDSKYEQSGSRTTALELLNDGYLDVCIETLCSRTSATITANSSSKEYDLPAGFISVLAVQYPLGFRYLEPVFYDRTKISVTQHGTPRAYYLTPNKIGFDVIPSGTFVYTMDYFTGPTAELTLTDSPDLIPVTWQPRVLPYYVLWKLFAIDKREEVLARAPFWKGVYEEKRDKMKAFFEGEGRYAGVGPELD